MATLAPASLPPTNETHPSERPATSTGDSSAPPPLTSVNGSPSRTARALARVRQHSPPSVGVLAITALPASAWISMACMSTLIG